MKEQDYEVTFAYKIVVEARSELEAVQNATMQLQHIEASEIKDALIAERVGTPPEDDEDE